MDVSVVILCYNQKDTITRTLDSILSQKTSCNYEVIIGDDDSKDGTRAICEEYQKNYPEVVKVLDYHENYGVVKNYVLCLSHCTGKYVMECAGDDWWSNPNKMQNQYDYLEAHPQCVLLHGGHIDYFPATGLKKDAKPGRCTMPQFDSLIRCNNICAPTVCIRKEALDRVGVEDFVKEGFAVEDYPTWLGLALQGEIHSVDDMLVTYTQQIGSLHNCQDYDRRISMLDNIRRMQVYMTKRVPDAKQYEVIINDSIYTEKAAAAVFHNRRRDALKYFSSIKQKDKKVLTKMLICMVPFLFHRFHTGYKKEY